MKLDLSGFRIDKIELSFEEPSKGGGSLRMFGDRACLIARMQCLRREDGEVGEIAFSSNIDGETWRRLYASDLRKSAERARSLLIEMLVHELDECLLVDGVRMFDPHKNEALPP